MKLNNLNRREFAKLTAAAVGGCSLLAPVAAGCRLLTADCCLLAACRCLLIAGWLTGYLSACLLACLAGWLVG